MKEEQTAAQESHRGSEARKSSLSERMSVMEVRRASSGTWRLYMGRMAWQSVTPQKVTSDKDGASTTPTTKKLKTVPTRHALPFLKV